MKPTCPQCSAAIPPTEVNVAANVASCPQCSEVFALSDIVSTQDIDPEFDITAPPKGAWFDEDFRGWRIGASTRSAAALFLVPFMCVWSGFSLGGIYGSQLLKGEFNPTLSLFGIPFVLGTLLFGSIAVMSVVGRVDVIVVDGAGIVFTGVGPLGWTRRFDWSEVTKIEEDVGPHSSGSSGYVLSFVGATRLKFGGMLSDPRRYYLLQGLRLLRRRQ